MQAPIHTVVAVSMDGHGEPQVTNPCGVCRELLRSYGTETSVMVDAEGAAETINISGLLPYPRLRATETEWTTEPPAAISHMA